MLEEGSIPWASSACKAGVYFYCKSSCFAFLHAKQDPTPTVVYLLLAVPICTRARYVILLLGKNGNLLLPVAPETYLTLCGTRTLLPAAQIMLINTAHPLLGWRSLRSST
jgi:hypothetical protein